MIRFKYGFSALLWYKYPIPPEIKNLVLFHLLPLKIKHGEKVFDLLSVWIFLCPPALKFLQS